MLTLQEDHPETGPDCSDGPQRFFQPSKPEGGYVSDLLSCVMAGAKAGNLWVTLQAHINIVAVAALTEVAAIIFTENAQPEPEVIAKANAAGGHPAFHRPRPTTRWSAGSGTWV